MRPIRVDFVKRPGPPMLGWLVLLIGVALLGALAQQYVRFSQVRASALQASQQQAQTVAEQERQRVADLPSPPPPYLDDRRWRRAATELALPWINTLRAVEQATKPPVFLVGFKSDPATGRLQLDAEAPSFDAALGYVSVLQAAPALSQTQILSHDDTPDPQGRPLTRISLQTQWVTTP
ncbi:MAG: hypothetical protein Q7U28_13115 [Aquabacterium sp.]|nr:hypothetical protein [Aquabacterium sp.]